jgi:hypothetical protein
MWRLDVRWMQRQGFLSPGYSGGVNWSQDGEKVAGIGFTAHDGYIVLKYRTRQGGGEWEDKEYLVRLARTPCNYGKTRPWFLCPCCGRRVAILWGDSIYACRHCHRLVYDCQREAPHYRLMSRAHKIRDRLGGERWCIKPKGMHQRTFDRLVDEYRRADALLWGAVAKRFNIKG